MASWAEAQYVIDELKQSALTENPTGIPPQNAGITLLSGDKNITIHITKPSETIIEKQVVCRPLLIRLLRKEGSIPEHPEDGVKVIDDIRLDRAFELDSIVDEGLKNNTTYGYRAFVQSDQGVWQKGPYLSESDTTNDRGFCTPTDTYIWGFDQNFADLNPATTITYPSDVINANYTPAITNEQFACTSGDWSDFLEKHLKNFPCMVKKNGELDYQLDPNDYKKKLDGSVSDYNNLNYQGGAFAWINKIYLKEEYADNKKSRKVRFCNKKLDGYRPIGFIDQDGVTELEGLWIPMGYTDNSGRVLIAGTKPSQSKTTAEQKAILDSAGFSKGVFFGTPILNVLRDLEYMIFKTTDIQKAAGYGRSNVSATDHLDHVINNDVVRNPLDGITGLRNAFYGTDISANKLNKMFHSQVLGSYQCWLRDPYTILANGGYEYVSPYYNYDLNANGYKLTNIHYSNSGSEQYMNRLVQSIIDDYCSEPAAPEPTLGTASSSTGLCDAFWWNTEGTRIANRLGGAANVTGLHYGPAAFGVDCTGETSRWTFSFSTLLLPPVGYSPFA